jgi:hypothetical protein
MVSHPSKLKIVIKLNDAYMNSQMCFQITSLDELARAGYVRALHRGITILLYFGEALRLRLNAKVLVK